MSSTRHYVTLAGLNPAVADSNSQAAGRALPSFQEFCEGVRALKHDDLLTNPNQQRLQVSNDRAAPPARPAGMSNPTATDSSDGRANTAARTEVTIAPQMISHRNLDGCILQVTSPGIASTAEALRYMRQSPDVSVQVRNFLNDPLPGFVRPLTCSNTRNTRNIPVQLYRYVEFLALNLASDEALLGIWVDMFNTMGIKISFAVMCAICEKMINQAPHTLSLAPGIALHDRNPLKEATLEKLILKVIALHQFAISEDGVRICHAQARLLGERFDPECSHRMVASVTIWNGFLVGRGRG